MKDIVVRLQNIHDSDTGERYLSTPLFADIAVDMTEDEAALSRSTPGYHLQPAA